MNYLIAYLAIGSLLVIYVLTHKDLPGLLSQTKHKNAFIFGVTLLILIILWPVAIVQVKMRGRKC
jgi:hypothetical protein